MLLVPIIICGYWCNQVGELREHDQERASLQDTPEDVPQPLEEYTLCPLESLESDSLFPSIHTNSDCSH